MHPNAINGVVPSLLNCNCEQMLAQAAPHKFQKQTKSKQFQPSHPRLAQFKVSAWCACTIEYPQ